MKKYKEHFIKIFLNEKNMLKRPLHEEHNRYILETMRLEKLIFKEIAKNGGGDFLKIYKGWMKTSISQEKREQLAEEYAKKYVGELRLINIQEQLKNHRLLHLKIFYPDLYKLENKKNIENSKN